MRVRRTVRTARGASAAGRAGKAPHVVARAARRADAVPLAALFAAYLRFYRLSPPRARVALFVRQRLRERPRRTWVAVGVGDGPLAGFVQVYETMSTLSLARVWVLNDLYVEPSARGAGVARALIERVIVEARRAGAVRVDLSTQVGNRKARWLYESLGFKRSTGFLSYELEV